LLAFDFLVDLNTHADTSCEPEHTCNEQQSQHYFLSRTVLQIAWPLLHLLQYFCWCWHG